MNSKDHYTVNEIVEGSSFGRPLSKIVGLCFLLMVCDSYDVAALSFAAPALIKTWGVTSSSMGVLFGVGMFGLLVGSIVFGQMGDRIGRKRAMVLGALAFSLLTTATGLATSEFQLLVLRFLATVGLGGAVPNAVALVCEFAPKRMRVTVVGAIFARYSCGGIVAGLTAAFVIPRFGWQSMFFLGGGISVLSSAAFALLLPESLAYLAMRPARSAEASRVATTLRPDLAALSKLQVLSDGADPRSGQFGDLFRGTLLLATPLMWLIYIANSMTVFGLISWMPVAAEATGLTRGAAAIATSLLFAGSAVGGVMGGRFADRFGFAAVAVMALAAFCCVAPLGMLGTAKFLLFPISFLAGCFAFGGQTCLHGMVGSLYPTPVRANGVGWAIGVAKVGSIVGPLLGGFLLPKVTTGQLFLTAAAPLFVVAILTMTLLKVFQSPQRLPPVAIVR